MLANPISDINQTDGVVIRSHASGESDLVLKVLTPELGKISVFAKHARASKKRFSGNIEILDRGVFAIKPANIKRNSNLYFIDGFTPKKTHFSFRTDFLKLSTASLLCEAFDLIIKEEQDFCGMSQQFYEAFCLGIDALDEGQNSGEILKACFITSKALMAVAGFIDREKNPVPNKKNLTIILNHIENCAEKKLLSRVEFEKIISAL